MVCMHWLLVLETRKAISALSELLAIDIEKGEHHGKIVGAWRVRLRWNDIKFRT